MGIDKFYITMPQGKWTFIGYYYKHHNEVHLNHITKKLWYDCKWDNSPKGGKWHRH